MKQEYIGGDFDDFLREEGILESARAVAAKRIAQYPQFTAPSITALSVSVRAVDSRPGLCPVPYIS